MTTHENQRSASESPLTALRDQVAKIHPGLITETAGGATLLESTVQIGPGGSLRINHAAVLLKSDASGEARFLVGAHGHLSLRRVTVASWSPAQAAPDTNLADGRSDIVASGAGAVLDIIDSQVAGLGDGPNNPGVSWRAGAGGTVSGSSFVANFRGGYGYYNGRLDIRKSSFSSSDEDGLLLLNAGPRTSVKQVSLSHNLSDGLGVQSSHGVRLASLTASGNTANGINLQSDTGLVLTKAASADNKASGLLVQASSGVRVTRLRAWNDQNGITVDDSNGVLNATSASDNKIDGLYVTGPSAAVVVKGGTFDHNVRGGVWITDGGLSINGAFINENQFGLSIRNPASKVTVVANRFEANTKDGLSFAGSIQAVRVLKNVFWHNLGAALSIDTAKVDLKPLVALNQVAKNQTAFRVRTG